MTKVETKADAFIATAPKARAKMIRNLSVGDLSNVVLRLGKLIDAQKSNEQSMQNEQMAIDREVHKAAEAHRVEREGLQRQLRAAQEEAARLQELLNEYEERFPKLETMYESLGEAYEDVVALYQLLQQALPHQLRLASKGLIVADDD